MLHIFHPALLNILDLCAKIFPDNGVGILLLDRRMMFFSRIELFSRWLLHLSYKSEGQGAIIRYIHSPATYLYHGTRTPANGSSALLGWIRGQSVCGLRWNVSGGGAADSRALFSVVYFSLAGESRRKKCHPIGGPWPHTLHGRVDKSEEA